jgi:ATP phosphoribosyltransferase regulatory subunit
VIPTDRWLLPEGVEEALPPHSERLEQARRRLLDLFHTWGYELVMPPFVEYLESLLVGTSRDLDLQTFKLVDQLNGRQLGVRADMTPQVARIDAHVLNRSGPTRLCYMGTVLRARGDGVGGSRSPLQVGAELYGHAGVDSDLEVIRLMLETLRRMGLRDLHLDLGHVGIYRALARCAALGEDEEYALFDVLQRKSVPELGAMLDALPCARGVAAALQALVGLHGGAEVLARARAALAAGGEAVERCLDHLDVLAARLARLEPDVTLHFDLGELRGYRYHTGVVFAAYVPGVGREIARGGRYDDIGAAFGRARPATGFSTDLRALCALAPEPAAPDGGAVYVAPGDVDEADARIRALRAAGERVVCGLAGADTDPVALGCDRVLVRAEGNWIVKEV